MEELFYANVEVPVELYKRKAYTMDDVKKELGRRLMDEIRDNLVVKKEKTIYNNKVIYVTKIRVDFCDVDYSSWENSSEGR